MTNDTTLPDKLTIHVTQDEILYADQGAPERCMVAKAVMQMGYDSVSVTPDEGIWTDGLWHLRLDFPGQKHAVYTIPKLASQKISDWDNTAKDELVNFKPFSFTAKRDPHAEEEFVAFEYTYSLSWKLSGEEYDAAFAKLVAEHIA